MTINDPTAVTMDEGTRARFKLLVEDYANRASQLIDFDNGTVRSVNKHGFVRHLDLRIVTKLESIEVTGDEGDEAVDRIARLGVVGVAKDVLILSSLSVPQVDALAREWRQVRG